MAIPIVLCIDEASHEQRLEPALSVLVPRDVEVVKVGALSARLTRCLGIGEISLRAWLPCGVHCSNFSKLEAWAFC